MRNERRRSRSRVASSRTEPSRAGASLSLGEAAGNWHSARQTSLLGESFAQAESSTQSVPVRLCVYFLTFFSCQLIIWLLSGSLCVCACLCVWAKSFWQRRNANLIQFWRNGRRVCVSYRRILKKKREKKDLVRVSPGQEECHWEPQSAYYLQCVRVCAAVCVCRCVYVQHNNKAEKRKKKQPQRQQQQQKLTNELAKIKSRSHCQKAVWCPAGACVCVPSECVRVCVSSTICQYAKYAKNCVEMGAQKQCQYRAEAACLDCFCCCYSIPFNMLFTFVVVLLPQCSHSLPHSISLSLSLSVSLFTLIPRHAP